MLDQRMLRIGGVTGLLFSLLSLSALATVDNSSPPLLGASGEEIARWYAVNTHFKIGNYLGIVAYVPGFVQLVVLTAMIRRREHADRVHSLFVLASGVFAYTVFACSLVVFQALPFLASSVAAEAVGTIAVQWFALDGLAGVPFLLAVAWAVRATGALPQGLSPFTVFVTLAATVMSAGALTTTPKWLAAGGLATGVGFISFFVWTAVIAVIMLRTSPDSAR